MMRTNTWIRNLAVFGFAFAASATAQASPFDEVASQEAIEHCVAQVGEQVNYGSADRVVHHVDSKRRAVFRYRLNIESIAYDGDKQVGSYTATCVVGVAGKAIKFEVRQSS